VLNNADDTAILSPTDSGSSGSTALWQYVLRYLPLRRHGSVLVTSQTKRTAIQVVEDCNIIAIELMRDIAAHALL
jgi:hypothetical protein